MFSLLIYLIHLLTRTIIIIIHFIQEAFKISDKLKLYKSHILLITVLLKRLQHFECNKYILSINSAITIKRTYRQ